MDLIFEDCDFEGDKLTARSIDCVPETIGFYAEGGEILLSFSQATAFCEAITAHIFADTSKRNAAMAKAEWETQKVGKICANVAKLSA